jgi:hypothetical protein
LGPVRRAISLVTRDNFALAGTLIYAFSRDRLD